MKKKTKRIIILVSLMVLSILIMKDNLFMLFGEISIDSRLVKDISKFKEKSIYLENINENEIVNNEKNQKPINNSHNWGVDACIKDIEFLKYYLEEAYAAYYYLDSKYNYSLKLEELKNSLKSKEEISKEEFENKLIDIFKDIPDGHFKIGEKIEKRNLNYYLSREEIEIKNNSYYLNGNKIRDIDYKNPDKFIRNYLNENGDIQKRIIKESKNNSGESCVINFDNGESKEILLINIKRFLKYKERVGYKNRSICGIKFIEIDNFNICKQNEKFAEDAINLKDEDVLIIDLRNHSGGNEEYGIRWMENFLNKKFLLDRLSIHRTTNTATEGLKKAFKYFYGGEANINELNKFLKDFKSDKDKEGWKVEKNNDLGIVNKQTIVFVLIDENTVSGGEMFVKMLKELPNCIVVGIPTYGAVNVGNVSFFKLPNSKIQIQMGISLFLDKYGWIDNKGIYPDIWSGTKELPEKLIKYIDKICK